MCICLEVMAKTPWAKQTRMCLAATSLGNSPANVGSASVGIGDSDDGFDALMCLKAHDTLHDIRTELFTK
jgi:hypothetical protein